MAYNLPPAWDAGYALPQNVRDEGLERRAFVTKQAPRGTYDDPRVPTGGYTVPPYVVQEGYGQGARTTAWARRGSYAGPTVPQWIQRQPTVAAQRSLGPGAAAVTFKVKAANAMSGLPDDAPLPASYQRFGDRAAAVIMGKISQLAPEHRKARLKAILDRLDPTLWGRTAAIAKKYVQQGLAASVAVHMALARAMSTGIAAEIVETGRTSSAPQPNSLLGLGCYGASCAMGALGDTTVTSNPPPGKTWDASIPPSGAWRRLRAGEVGKPNPDMPGGVVVTTTVHTGPSVKVGTANPPGQVLVAGPWQFPIMENKPAMISAPAGAMPPAWIPILKQMLTIDPTHVFKKMPSWQMATPKNPLYQRIGFAPGQLMGIWHASFGDLIDKGKQTRAPIAVFKHPVTGKEWGIYLGFRGDDKIRQQTGNLANDRMNPTRVTVSAMEIKERDYPWYVDIGRAITWVPAKIVDGVKAVVEAVADLACKAASSPNAQQAGAAAGVAVGAGASIGAAGAAIASALCNSPPPVVAIPPPAPTSSILPLAMAAGGIVLVAALLSKKGE